MKIARFAGDFLHFTKKIELDLIFGYIIVKKLEAEMKRRAFISSMLCTSALVACQRPQPKVDLIVVEKGKRRMTTYRNKKPYKIYNIGLGWAPVGHKQFEGDGRTPEGRYYIWTKNPRSSFHLSLGISYPNSQDVMNARRYGMSPGGDIFIHGESRNPNDWKRRDWTAGCIAVKNSEIEELYREVGVGTVIDIRP